MKITVNNLAQITKAENIEIKKFNVFIGKNGTGKTFFSKLIYFINAYKYKLEVFEKHFSKKLENSYQNKSDIIFTVEEQKKFINDLSNYIKINFPEYTNVSSTSMKNFNLKINTDIVKEEIILKSNTVESLSDYIIWISFDFFSFLFGNIEAHYLPAARANYMITYKYLFESQYNNVRDMLLKRDNKTKIEILPEIENNFLKDIYKVDTKKRGELCSLATKIEKEIFISGKLSIKNPKHQDLPTYEYRLKNKENLDLVAASSSVTELSPLLMYLRHKIINCNNELLIIDEPELSLHPDAQSKLVEIMVEATNMGLKIILVTHSPYILESLNNHLMRYKIKEYNLPKEIISIAPINPSETTAYLFEDGTIKNVLDNELNLIDDILLNSFNSVNNYYEKMRDIEWENK